MSISGAFSNALSGLTATSRAAELVSSNVANAMTEGYGTRSLALSTQTPGSGGVRIGGVLRQVDEALIGDRRLADAATGYHGAQNTFLQGVEQAIGTPDQPASLSGRLAQFEATLIEAAARPDSQTRQSAVLNAAQGLITHLKATSDHIQSARLDADQAIAGMVATLNAGLEDVRALNVKIQAAQARGADPSGLMDLRQQKIDALSPIVPLKQLPRDNGAVVLVTTGGAMLLDGKPATLGFSTVNMIVPEMTRAGGALSGLTLNGQPLETGGDRSPLAGGALSGQFAVRDELAVVAQERLDGFARDLVERFQDPTLDATRAPGDPGLFTDAGAAFAPADEVALSSRLMLNAAVDPAQGGSLWRLRDGLGAAAQGNVGDASLLNGLIDRLGAIRTPVSGGFTSTAHSAAGLASELLSSTSSERLQTEARLGFASSQQQTLRQMELAQGVDTDAQLQKLMQIEQAYAANARVMSTADEMIQTLLAI